MPHSITLLVKGPLQRTLVESHVHELRGDTAVVVCIKSQVSILLLQVLTDIYILEGHFHFGYLR